MSRILVTEAAGFIGAFLCRQLLEEGDAHIVGFDNVNDYYDVGNQGGPAADARRGGGRAGAGR